MTRSRTPASRRNAARRPSAFTGLDNLEGRQLFAVAPVGQPFEITGPPDNAGNTPTAAAIVSLEAMEKKTIRDHLPTFSDLDYYRVHLEKGDFLAVDLDPGSTVALSAAMSMTNAAGGPVSYTSMNTEPEHGVLSNDPAIGFSAPAAGDYLVQVRTTSKTTNWGRSYDLKFERVATDTTQTNPTLAADGAFRTWLGHDSKTLHVTGPSGYGFSMRGVNPWATGSSGSNVTYSAQGTVYLSTPYLLSSIGEIALQPASSGFAVKATTVGGWRGLGKFAGTTGNFGFSLAPIAGKIKQAVGLDVSSVSVMDKWTIKTGDEIRNGGTTPVKQVLAGVPYLMFGDMGKVSAQLGDITVTEAEQSSTVLIAEPADPMLYVRYKKFAGAASVNGRIPFNNTVAPPDRTLAGNGNDLGVGHAIVPKYYGHLFGDGEVQVNIMGIPFHFRQDTTVDLDANHDGQLIGGVNPTDVFRSGAALGAALGDLNIGSNGKADVGYDYAGYEVRANLATSSMLYSGPEAGVWFTGETHSPSLFSGTSLAAFEPGNSTTLRGYVASGGKFSVASTSEYHVYGLEAEATIEVASEGTIASTSIYASGSIDTLIGSAHVEGEVWLNGNFSWSGDMDFYMDLDVPNVNAYLKGDIGFTLVKTGSQVKFTTNGAMEAGFKINYVCDVELDLTGHLYLTYTPSGTDYSASFNVACDLDAWAPVVGWYDVANADGGFSINNDRIRLWAGSHSMSYYL